MFGNYVATSDDLKTIEKALEFVFHPKMKFVFSDFSRIKNTLVISYDSKFIYAWQIEPIKMSKIKHNLTISDEHQLGWMAGLEVPEIMNLLPNKIKTVTRFEIPIISGGLLTPFIELQKNKKLPNNPYTTKESYLATIIHEFGHIYWNSFKLWWYSNKDENIRYLNLAIKYYSSSDKQNSQKKLPFYLPAPSYLSEVFAFCTEYYAAEIFWKKHNKNHDLFTLNRLNMLTGFEDKRNLDKENSNIEPEVFHHDFASVLGKLIITKHPDTWPQILVKYRPIVLP